MRRSPAYEGAGVLERASRWQARHPRVAVPIAVVRKFIEDDAPGLGVQVAYWGLFSVFSLLLAFVSILGFAFDNDPSFQKRVLDTALELMPVIGPQISGHTGTLTGSGVALAIGLVGALWTGLGDTLAIGNALERIWAVPGPERTGFVNSRFRGLLVLASVAAGTVAATATLGLSTAGAITPAIGDVLGVAVAAGIDLVVILASFRLLTAAAVTVRQVLPGAVLAAGCLAAATGSRGRLRHPGGEGEESSLWWVCRRGRAACLVVDRGVDHTGGSRAQRRAGPKAMAAIARRGASTARRTDDARLRPGRGTRQPRTHQRHIPATKCPDRPRPVISTDQCDAHAAR